MSDYLKEFKVGKLTVKLHHGVNPQKDSQYINSKSSQHKKHESSHHHKSKEKRTHESTKINQKEHHEHKLEHKSKHHSHSKHSSPKKTKKNSKNINKITKRSKSRSISKNKSRSRTDSLSRSISNSKSDDSQQNLSNDQSQIVYSSQLNINHINNYLTGNQIKSIDNNVMKAFKNKKEELLAQVQQNIEKPQNIVNIKKEPSNAIMISNLGPDISKDILEDIFREKCLDYQTSMPEEIRFLEELKMAYIIFPSIPCCTQIYEALNGKIFINGIIYDLTYTPNIAQQNHQESVTYVTHLTDSNSMTTSMETIVHEDWYCEYVK